MSPMNLDEMALRWIGLSDACQLSRVHAACFADAWSADALKTLVQMPGVFGLLVEDTSAIHGFILCRVVADEAEVLTLAVLPTARRRGLGRRLLLEAIEGARTLGAARLLLEVGEKNESARALYTSAGLGILGRRRGYYRLAGEAPQDALTLGMSL